MNESIPAYLLSVKREFETGNATEHSYRPCLKSLIEDIDETINAINEPKRQACGAPDYIITRKEVPIGFIEAKDVGKNLDEVEKSEQMDRYLESLENLILTDYLEFRFYIQGERVDAVRIARIENGELIFENENVERFENLLKNFVAYHGQTIKSASKLAKAMAGKARLMKDVIVKSLNDEDRGGELRSELDAFRQILIHDMKEEEFADMYAQTIAYGLFAARLHDPSLATFSRQEAAELLPKTNPFLRKLFHTVAGPDLDTRIVWIVDALADVFRATDIKKILESFSSESKRLDPFIHFYETFLSEYNPKLRKSRGVWYTPEPVVKFIVRAIDDILKTEFNLPKGLADTSMTTIEVEAQMADGRYKDGKKRIEKQVHRVQVLDPATGTGTFLAEVVRKIHSHFEGQAGIWESYVNEHLLPRIHGFELLMAPYAMCHLKLDLLLTELGYKHKDTDSERLSVYLTNSLEEAHPDTNTLFSSWLSNEANEANNVKKETPVMVVLGNPPYSVSSSNKGEWIQNLIGDYKQDLNERKINLDDDYIKFIRYGQHFIEKNGEGVLAYISNNSFIDGITHRQMRKSLLETFDDIYIVDLHGNSKKKEISPDGGKDENVFDIMQGVSINIFVKNSESEGLGRVHHVDVFGKREKKYEWLEESYIQNVEWNDLEYKEPYYFFVPKDFVMEEEYKKGFGLSDLFLEYNSGIQTKNDDLALRESRDDAKIVLNDFKTLPKDELVSKYKIKDTAGWKIDTAIKDLNEHSPVISTVQYNPFDEKYTLYTGYSSGFLGRPRQSISNYIIDGHNPVLITMRQYATGLDYSYAFVSKGMVTDRFFYSNKGTPYMLPLYSKSKDGDAQSNLNPEIVDNIKKIVANPSPEDIFDYIYTILYSSHYREKYREFLKINFPRIPYPETAEQFKKLAILGGELRQWHLMEYPDSENLITQFPISASNQLEKGYPKFKDGQVFINQEQYFDNVPEVAWNFYIGGYQPAQKWLKDRSGCVLTFDDILHWQKIIVALVNTDRIMKEIDELDI